jgi:5-methylcytosine-specific restriction endonuclease McrA
MNAVVRRYKLRKRGTLCEPYSRRFIFERDEGICGICKEPINWYLPPYHREGFTIDHLTPVSIGGTDTICNVRAAHRWCNSKRGAGRGVVVVKRRKVKVLV